MIVRGAVSLLFKFWSEVMGSGDVRGKLERTRVRRRQDEESQPPPRPNRRGGTTHRPRSLALPGESGGKGPENPVRSSWPVPCHPALLLLHAVAVWGAPKTRPVQQEGCVEPASSLASEGLRGCPHFLWPRTVPTCWRVCTREKKDREQVQVRGRDRLVEEGP